MFVFKSTCWDVSNMNLRPHSVNQGEERKKKGKGDRREDLMKT